MPEVQPPSPERARKPVWRWALAAAVIWAGVWVTLGGQLDGFREQAQLAAELRPYTRRPVGGAEDFPWLRQQARNSGLTPQMRSWTLEDWARRLWLIEDQRLGMDLLLGPANARARDVPESGLEAPALDPDWDVLFPGAVSFNAQLWESGLREEQLRRHFLDYARVLGELEIRATQALPAPPTPPEEEVLRRFHEAHQHLFALPETFVARHIFLAAHTGKPEDLRQRQSALAAELAQALREDPEADFTEYAKLYSEDEATRNQGGLLPEFTAARMPADFLEAVRAAKPGVLSGPVQTRLGYHLLRVEEVRPARKLTFEEARPLIERAFAQAELVLRRRDVQRLAGTID